MILQHVNETPNFKGGIRYEAKYLWKIFQMLKLY